MSPLYPPPNALAGMVALSVSILTFFYATKIPLKRKYHHMFMFSVANIAVWAGFYSFAQMADSPETFAARVWWSLFFGAPSFWALLYHFALLFIRPKFGRLRYTLIPVYGYVVFWWVMLLFDPTLYYQGARSTLLGFVQQSGTLTPYLNPLGINLNNNILTVLLIVVLIAYYRSQQSSLVKGQLRYLLVGVILFGVGLLTLTVGRYVGGIALNPYFNSAGVVVIMLGLRKHGFFAVTPTAETQSKVPLRYNLLQGFSYLASEPEPKQSFEVFSNLALNGYNGLCITRSSPSTIRETYSLKTTPILWLTEEKSDDAVAPSDLHGLLVTIKVFLQKAERSVITLHGLEYLISVNGFKPVIRLIARLSDLVLQKNGILLLPVVPGTINEKQQTFLSAECPSLQRLEVSQIGEVIASPFQPRQELPPLVANTPLPAEAYAQEPLQFKQDDAEKAFRFLAKAFLQDYTVSRLVLDAAGWRTALEIAEGATLPARKMYGRDGGPGTAIAELLKRGLIETRWVTGQRGRGGTIMKVRINYANPYVKAEVDRRALRP